MSRINVCNKKLCLLLFCIIRTGLITAQSLFQDCNYGMQHATVISDGSKKEKGYLYKSMHFFGGVVIDALDLHWQLFSITSAKILVGFTPFYLTMRMLDEDFQKKFYDKKNHKNINQFHDSCHKVAKTGVAAPMVFLSSMWIFGWNDDLRYTGRMTAIGLPFVHSGKDVLKKIKSRCCLRPWNEHFNNKMRARGGFPSGHMANVTFMATLWGWRHGPRWGVPLGLFSGFVFADFLNQNRHYLSQLIAGVGLGMLYAFAANKVIEKRLSDRVCLDLGINEQGGPNVKVAYKF